MTSKEVLDFAKKNKVVMVDLKFVDFPGTWQHFTIPIEELTDTVFTEGSGFDGSSIRGWQAIQNSDMMVVPDPDTAVMDLAATVGEPHLPGRHGPAALRGEAGLIGHAQPGDVRMLGVTARKI